MVTHELCFHRTATFEHRDAPSIFKNNARQLARMRFRHQRLVARDILGLREPMLTFKLLLHRCFVSISILRSMPARSAYPCACCTTASSFCFR